MTQGQPVPHTELAPEYLTMKNITSDQVRRNGGIHPTAVGDEWTPDPAAKWIIADLEKSGITPSTAAAARLAHTDSPDRIRELLNRRSPLPGGTCLVIPYFDETGAPADYCRLKPERPRTEKRDGKERAIKYDSPVGFPARLYIPPSAVPGLLDPEALLIVTEGEKKALALVGYGLLAVAVPGVWNLVKKLDGVDKGKTFEDYQFRWPAGIPVEGRRVVLLMDSDTRTKDNLPLAVKYIRQHFAALGAQVRVARLPDGQNGEKVGADDFLRAHGPDALRAIIAAADNPAKKPGAKKDNVARTTDGATNRESKEKDPPAAEVLTAIGCRFDLWHDPDDRAYASAGRRTYVVKSKAFKTLLVARYRDEMGGKVPNSEALSAAILALEGIAVHDRPEHDAHTRVAEHAGRVYVYLANNKDTVIEIGPDGWRECDAPPVRFVRHRGMLALPMPRRGGRLEDLRRLINCPEDSAFVLLLAWLAAALRGRGPFPLLALLGEQGSAKTTTGRVLKRLLDPRALDVRAEPKETRDLMIAARTNWLLVYDNLSHLPGWLSDALCRLATGGGFGTRELYTDDEEQTFLAMRPAIANGIEDFITRPDLLERSLLLRHPPIDETRRRSEADLWAEFNALAPGLLGALFDYVAGGFRELPNVRLPGLPRMADFATFAVACETARVGNGEVFLQTYRDNQAGANEQVLDDSPVAGAVRTLMANHVEWRGTATELLDKLKALVPEAVVKDREWPKRANALSNRLKRLAPTLRRAAAIDVQIGIKDTDRTRTRLTVIRRMPDMSRGESSEPSAFANSPESTAAKPADDVSSDHRPPTVRSSSHKGVPVQPESPSPDGPDGPDDPSRSVSGSPSAPPVTPDGRRRGRV
jgi:hypothetical protein